MTYLSPFPHTILSPDKLNRRVLFAVELFDPISQSLVSAGVALRAKGVTGDPIVNFSGRFVWLGQAGQWPQEISVIPIRLPFFPETVLPPLPEDPQHPTIKERLVRVTLRPTPAYIFPAGITVIRGQLRERSDQPSPPVTDAHVQLAWCDKQHGACVWIPSPPASAQAVATDANGEFVVFLRLTSVGQQVPDSEKGLLHVRLQFTQSFTTWVTPDDFPFLADQIPDHLGRVYEGRLLDRDLRLGWADLIPM
jgi:hypothetical protein